MRTSMRRRAGFTLVELVVVIMIIGILAAIAAPKIFKTTQTANDNAARANLRMIRDAIDTYAANNAGAYPPAANLAAQNGPLAPYLRSGVLPNCPVGATPTLVNTNGVQIGTGTSTQPPTPDNTTAYMYDQTYGWFILNNTNTSYNGAAYSTF